MRWHLYKENSSQRTCEVGMDLPWRSGWRWWFWYVWNRDFPRKDVNHAYEVVTTRENPTSTFLSRLVRCSFDWRKWQDLSVFLAAPTWSWNWAVVSFWWSLIQLPLLEAPPGLWASQLPHTHSPGLIMEQRMKLGGKLPSGQLTAPSPPRLTCGETGPF